MKSTLSRMTLPLMGGVILAAGSMMARTTTYNVSESTGDDGWGGNWARLRGLPADAGR